MHYVYKQHNSHPLKTSIAGPFISHHIFNAWGNSMITKASITFVSKIKSSNLFTDSPPTRWKIYTHTHIFHVLAAFFACVLLFLALSSETLTLPQEMSMLWKHDKRHFPFFHSKHHIEGLCRHCDVIMKVQLFITWFITMETNTTPPAAYRRRLFGDEI